MTIRNHLLRGLIAIGCSTFPLIAAAQYSVPMNTSVEQSTNTSTNSSVQNSTFNTPIELDHNLSFDIMTILGVNANPTTFERKLIRTFAHVGAESDGVHTSIFDNSSLSDSAFDFRQYVYHRCFNIMNDYDRAWCAMEFGLYGDLRANLFNGTLSKILVRHGIIDANDSDLVSGVGFDVQIQEEGGLIPEGAFGGSDSSLATNANRLFRSQTLWNLCGTRNMETQAACFQDNKRLLLDSSIDVESNLYFQD
jgi:hypothetical protein